MMGAFFLFGLFSLCLTYFLGSYAGIYFNLVFILIVSIIWLFMFLTISYSLSDMWLFLDTLSVNLVILSFFITLLMVISSYKIYMNSEYFNVYLFTMFILNFVLLITFFSGDLLNFYFFFEISLIPTFFIIMGWGYQPERLQAGVYFIFYTLTASLPLLLAILYMGSKTFNLKGVFYYFSYSGDNFMNAGSFEVNVIFSLVFIMAFMVKLPMFFTHLWLPKAHVEAPVAGSMILAGVLLKLGGYGLMRVGMLFFSKIYFISSYFFALSLLGMFYVGLLCCRLNDFKSLVAYSSVAHMGMVICGILTFYMWGYIGGLLLMVSHGLASSGLFCIVNMYYERLNSRSFFINSGLILLFPIMSLLIFVLSAANIAAPPTINLMSEIFLMGSILSYDLLMMLVFPIGSFLGAVFTIFMYSYTQHGKIYFLSFGVMGLNFREIHVLFMHILPVNFLILNPFIFFML